MSVSPVFVAFSGLQGNVLSLACCLLIFLLIYFRDGGVRLSRVVVVLTIGVTFACCLFSLWWGVAQFIAYPIYFLAAVLCGSICKNHDRIQIVEAASNFILLVALGAVVGFCYAYVGGAPLLEIENPDGRSAYLYLTTMTNWRVGTIIRPSGIFDEPGALSFFICFVCGMRRAVNLPSKKTIWLLMLGLITLSVAHVIFVVLYLMSEKVRTQDVAKFSVPFLVVFGIMLLNDDLMTALDAVLFSRFDVIDGKVAGDNRSDLFMNALQLVNQQSFFWGVDSVCITDPALCNALYEPFGENILSLLVLTGIGPALPFYLLSVYLIFVGIIARRNLYILGLFLVLAQRPNLMSFGYALVITLAAFTIYKRSEFKMAGTFCKFGRFLFLASKPLAAAEKD